MEVAPETKKKTYWYIQTHVLKSSAFFNLFLKIPFAQGIFLIFFFNLLINLLEAKREKTVFLHLLAISHHCTDISSTC